MSFRGEGDGGPMDQRRGRAGRFGQGLWNFFTGGTSMLALVGAQASLEDSGYV